MEGIEYLHYELGVCHRDLKPENLLLSADYKTIKIADFGLSNTCSPGSLLKSPVGSRHYAAPELCAQKKYMGLSADLWSTGVILYAMVCGVLPFDDPDSGQLFEKIIIGDFNIPLGVISDECKDLIEKFLIHNTQDRWSLEQIKEHPWYINYGNFSNMNRKHPFL
jgi:5'-AMP-activated protein kinase, catalytic alpha subunit